MLINDTVNVDIPKEPDLDKLVLKRFKHLVSELRELCEHEHGAHLARSRPYLTWHELFVLEVFLPSTREAIAANKAAARDPAPRKKILKDERVLRDFIPGVEFAVGGFVG